MKKNYAAIITAILLFFAGNVFGQHLLVTNAQKKELDDLSTKKNDAYSAGHQKAVALAKTHGWVVRAKLKNGGIISLQGLNSHGRPMYLKTNDNAISAATTRTNTVQPGGSLGLNLSGSSSFLDNKLAIWDGGAVYAAHQEFAGKTITLKTTQPILDHSTHVAGTMIAKGVYAPAKGMSFNASTLLSYDFDNDITTISAAASSLLLSNHSYGDTAGWDFDNNGNWNWYGLPGDTVDYDFGIYDSRAQSYDQIAYKAPYYLIVESAGNARGYPGPDIGGTYYGYKSATDATLVLKTRTAGSNISSQQGYIGIATTGNAKNVLTVGAVGPLPYGPSSSNDVAITTFSSYGPTNDGRVKPDIAGMGLNVLSCGVINPQSYLVLSGTSMSSPNVTGSLYLLQEYYAKQNSGNFMHSATLKALACGTAFDAGNPGPDYIYGWGLLDMQKAATAITDNGTKSIIKELALAQGQKQSQTVMASGNGALMATIAWTDPAGVATDYGVGKDPTIKLVNDLDIRISDGTTTYYPWVLNPATPGAAATTGDNKRDNVEQVYLPGAVPGKTYTITVSQKGILQSGLQAYALVVTGIGGTAYCTSAPLSNADSKITNVTLANINNTAPAGCTTYADYTNLIAQLEQGKTYPLSISAGTCGGNFNKIAKVFIDWNGDGNFTDTGELVATTGVISRTGTYNTQITVPTTVIPGNYSLMRVVLTETSDPAAVTACGSYAKGETQDYKVQFIQTTNDAGVTAIINPGSAGNCAGINPITIAIKNFGSAPISNVPVTVTIKAPDNTLTTLNETDPDTIPPLGVDNYTLNSTFSAIASAAYTITATTNLANDVIIANNQATATTTINAAPVISSLAANYCDEASQYLLTGTGDGELFWYKNAADTAPFAFGSTVNTSVVPLNNTFYAGLNDFSGTVGPATKKVFSGGGYNQFGPSIYVHANVPVIMQSARLYIGNSGKITFTVSNSNGETLSSTTINAIATSTHPQAGAQADDPNDQGKVYNLNLLIPAAGDYIITTTFDNTATLYRNNAGVTGYPFLLGDVFSITGNSATSGSATDTTFYKGFYYYFYNLQIKSAGCASDVKQAVVVKRPIITQIGTTLSSNFVTGNQWYVNGNIISSATSQSYNPTASGLYKLKVTLNSGCTDTSAAYVYVLVPKNSNNDIGLSVYPVPASTVLNVFFVSKAASGLIMQLINEAGKIAYTSGQTIPAGNINAVIKVEALPPGNYILKLLVGQKVYGTKIIIER
jgi:hypothetical protein